MYDTQRHDLYSKHVIGNGLNFGTSIAPKYRKVLTTRKDGDITIYEKNGKILVKSFK